MNTRSSMVLAVLVICTVTIAAGLVEGRLSDRWGEPPDRTSAGERLAAVPERIGDWEMQSSASFEEDVAQMLQCAGSFSRVYVDSVTGDTVNVALSVGPPGPTAVHTPEICYSSRGQTIVERPTVVSTHRESAPDETLWQMTFRSNDIEQKRFRVVYGWTGPDGNWRAMKNARFEYGGQPLLYKIQLAGPLAGRTEDDGADPCYRFLKVFLPTLDTTLFPTSTD